MSDVNLLARHINALNNRTELLSDVLHQHGDHLSSYMSVMDNRTTNLMSGIQINSKEIATLAHSMKIGDKLFSTQVQLSVPNCSLYSHGISNTLTADQQIHLNLKKMTAAVRNDSKIFKTLSEPLLDGRISIRLEWPDLNAVLVITSLGLESFAIIICIYLFLKFRKLATAMFVLQQVSIVKSQEIPSFIYKKLTPPTTSASELEKCFAS
ncbi:unnamed protein product [Mytilus coruscus]|uniref:Uncharacterized protein n=1 Tax=Mytilus coruscus TaxID=42192 RepID=A0A6J8BSU8_MYTCO|nr:unnamed protein product [Mytilus coruscus]